MSTSTQPFQAEVRQLLDIVIHALYSDREIFIRELVSNASDALEKLRLKQLTDPQIYQPERPLSISIKTDPEQKTITISDSGIGMSQEDLIQNLGTIAHSGTKKFLEALKNSNGNTDLIGQFGVGFYSSFMVADKVEVTTHASDTDATGLKWVSDGREGYTIDPVDNVDRGTSITVYLKEENAEFTKEHRIREILRRYSNFVNFPIEFAGERLNTVQAIWAKSKSDVTPAEYDEFFQFIAHTDESPLSYMHFSADAPISLNSLLFIPKENPEIFGFGRTDSNVALYCHRVLIDAKPEGLLPEWLRFLHGIVDSEDLPLNISREMLQDNSLIRKISEIITKRFIKHLEKLAKDDTETYDTFYTKFSRYLKEGVVTSWANKEALGSLLRFESTFTDVGTNTSFADYVSRMKEDQKAIYVLSGVSRAQMEQSPYMEAFKARGYEVAFFTDHGDEFVIDSLSSIDAKPLTFINKADIELPETNMEGNALTSEDATELNTWLDELYKGKFDKVTIGNRLVSGAAVVLQSNDTMGPEMRAYMKAMGQEVPESHPQLELNPRNELVKKLSELRKDNPELASLVADQITNTALLRAGILDNPGQLAQSSEDLLSKLLLKKD
ncbi:MAG: molecular chaperone HtpG [Akkermansia sp.]